MNVFVAFIVPVHRMLYSVGEYNSSDENDSLNVCRLRVLNLHLIKLCGLKPINHANNELCAKDRGEPVDNVATRVSGIKAAVILLV